MSTRIKPIETSSLLTQMGRQSFIHAEWNDCSIRALAILIGLPYAQVLDAFAMVGRAPGQGAWAFEVLEAAKTLGYYLQPLGPTHIDRSKFPPPWIQSIIRKYPGRHKTRSTLTTYHPRRFPDAWKDVPDLLLETAGHHAAYKDGIVHDYSTNHSRRIIQAYRITRIR